MRGFMGREAPERTDKTGEAEEGEGGGMGEGI